MKFLYYFGLKLTFQKLLGDHLAYTLQYIPIALLFLGSQRLATSPCSMLVIDIGRIINLMIHVGNEL